MMTIFCFFIAFFFLEEVNFEGPYLCQQCEIMSRGRWLAIILLQRMSSYNYLVKKIYGNLSISKDNTNYIHHQFTLYRDPKSKEEYLLKTVEFPSYLYISEGTCELTTQKYRHILLPMKVFEAERTFQNCVYLVRASQNIILLRPFLEIKRDCEEEISVDLFKKFLQFVIEAFKIVEEEQLQWFSFDQIGITDSKEIKLCDPSLYFRSKQRESQEKDFGKWIKKLVFSFFSSPNEQKEQFVSPKSSFSQGFTKIDQLIKYLLSGNATMEGLQANFDHSFMIKNDESTTVSQINTQQNQFCDQGLHKSKIIQKTNIKKVGKLGRLIIVLSVVTFLVGVGYITFKFMNKQVQCQQGYYAGSQKICLSCFEGCVRCESSSASKCMKCSINMYFVVEEQGDKLGVCLKECKGRLIAQDVCVRDKSQNTDLPGILIVSLTRQ